MISIIKYKLYLSFVSLLQIDFTFIYFFNFYLIVLFGLLWIIFNITTSSNIIYLIINLGAMCIILVLTWSISISSNLIILLYALIFVGAIVVFFLSTISTLPKKIISNKYIPSINYFSIIIFSIIICLFSDYFTNLYINYFILIMVISKLFYFLIINIIIAQIQLYTDYSDMEYKITFYTRIKKILLILISTRYTFNDFYQNSTMSYLNSFRKENRHLDKQTVAYLDNFYNGKMFFSLIDEIFSYELHRTLIDVITVYFKNNEKFYENLYNKDYNTQKYIKWQDISSINRLIFITKVAPVHIFVLQLHCFLHGIYWILVKTQRKAFHIIQYNQYWSILNIFEIPISSGKIGKNFWEREFYKPDLVYKNFIGKYCFWTIFWNNSQNIEEPLTDEKYYLSFKYITCSFIHISKTVYTSYTVINEIIVKFWKSINSFIFTTNTWYYFNKALLLWFVKNGIIKFNILLYKLLNGLKNNFIKLCELLSQKFVLFSLLFFFISIVPITVINIASKTEIPYNSILNNSNEGILKIKSLLFEEHPGYLFISVVILFIGLIGSAYLVSKNK